MTNPILQVKNIGLIYHTNSSEMKALSDISFNVEKGEFVSIIGPSGCGKSTLLSIIAKLISPSYGEILINNVPLQESKTTLGYMLQKDHLFEWRNIWQNVILGLEIKNNINDKNLEFVENLLKRYDLINFKTYKPSQLSGGMRQRAALIRTLAINPEILLLDEPFSALDSQTRLTVSNEIVNIIKNENKTAILVTHDINEAISLSDKIIVFSNRPSKVINIHKINLSKESDIINLRTSHEFNECFNTIWKELN